jgi:hypothetical protein
MKGNKEMEENKQEPNWRSNGAIFVVLKSFKEIISLLGQHEEEKSEIKDKLNDHFIKHIDDMHSDDAMIAFCEINDKLWDLESNIQSSCDAAILTSCIDIEARVNMVCFYNIGEVTTDAIETLPLVNKLEVAHRILDIPQLIGTQQYTALKELVSWRNAYAHGKCTDMNTKSLKKNHLESPEKYPDYIDSVNILTKQSSNYLYILDHLRKVSKHPKTSGKLTQHEEIRELNKELKNILRAITKKRSNFV